MKIHATFYLHFYLTNFDIINIEVNETNFSNEDKISSTIKAMVNSYFEDYPIYTIDPNDVKQNMTKLFLKDISVKGDNLALLLSL